MNYFLTFIVLSTIFLVAYSEATTDMDWSSCLTDGWVPFRWKGEAKPSFSFYACKYEVGKQ